MRLVLALGFILACFQDPQAVLCPMKNLQEALWCQTDEIYLQQKELTDKGECWKCNKKPVKVKVCVVDYYACTGCTKKSLTPATCCAGKMIKKTSRARVIYRCKGCGTRADKPTTCSNGKCEMNGKKYAEYCEKSGTFPHGNRDQ